MKSYIVEFTHRVSGETFLKFGHTKYSDVMKRFEYNPEQYQDYYIVVLASMKHNALEEAESVESDFLDKYPKNLSLPRYFSGITEIYKPEDKQERAKILREFYTLKESIESKPVKKKVATVMPWPVYELDGSEKDNKLMVSEEGDKLIIDKKGDKLITDQLTDDLLAR